jgi:MFS family permease
MTSRGSLAIDPGSAFSWRFVTPLFMGSALNPINSSLIATALVPIAAFLHISVGRTVVLVSGLYLASAIAQPTAGKLSEEFGPRRVFLIGVTLVLAGGIVGGLAQNLTTLVIARVLIGIGTSAGYPSAMLMIRRRAGLAGLTEPPGGVLGGLQIAGVTTAALGLPLGGVLVDAFGWRAVFWANLPVALLTLLMAVRLPPDPSTERARTARGVATRIDSIGIVAFGGAMSALIVFLDSVPHPHWIALGLSALLFVALVAWELRATHPFIDVRLLASNLALTRTYVRFGLISLCIYTVLYGLTQWIEVARGVSARDTGLLLLPMTGLSALILRPTSNRNLVRLPLLVAAAASTLGSVGILLLTTGTATIWIVAISLVFGIALGTYASGNQTALYIQAPGPQIGTASGLIRTAGYVGSIASSAIIAIVFHTHVSDHGLHSIAAIMIAVSILALLLTLADRHLRNPAHPAAADHRGTSIDHPPHTNHDD